MSAAIYCVSTPRGPRRYVWEGEELCVCDLAWISSRAQNLVSHHLRQLRSHRLVTSRKSGKLVMYSLTEEGRSLLHAVLGEKVIS